MIKRQNDNDSIINHISRREILRWIRIWSRNFNLTYAIGWEINFKILRRRIPKIFSPLKLLSHFMSVLGKSDWSDYLRALYEISPKIVHFALSRHQARNLKIRIQAIEDNINAVILIPKVWRSDHRRDRSNFLFLAKIYWEPKLEIDGSDPTWDTR